MPLLGLVGALVVVVAGAARGADADAWRGRAIYQLLTDRFARDDPTDERPCDLRTYCGGTWRGAARELDYIADMGFDAVWISPYVANTPGGYHGYWQQDLYRVNEHFGGADALRAFVDAAHERGMYVMMDVIANHMGPLDSSATPFARYAPFNSSAHYHACAACPRDNCQIADYTCLRDEIQLCRLAGLPDLNQTVPFVRDQLHRWVRDAVATYGFDGLRIDTVPEIDLAFWPGFRDAAGVYCVGEVFADIECCKTYQQPGDGLDAVLSFPKNWAMRDVFANARSMYHLRELFDAYNAFADADLLGTFVDNHDIVRFLHLNGDRQRYKNALAYTLYSRGIPIVYYGSEQAFDGGDDPDNREPLWPTKYDRSGDLYGTVRALVRYRQHAGVHAHPQVERYAADNVYAFTRGTTFVATTNVGADGADVRYTITYHPYAPGDRLCNVLVPDAADCVTVAAANSFDLVLRRGECKVFAPDADARAFWRALGAQTTVAQ